MTSRLVGTLALAASVTLAPEIRAAAPPAVASGVYDNTLILAVGPDGRFTGHFDMRDEGPPERDCIVDFRGKLAGNGGTITAYDAGDPTARVIDGRIAATSPGAVRITLPEEPDGCGNTWSFAKPDDPADFKLERREPWTAIREVKADRAYFSPSPGAPHGRAYVVQFNGVGVRATQAGWVQADFPGGARDTSGWLKESDLYPP